MTECWAACRVRLATRCNARIENNLRKLILSGLIDPIDLLTRLPVVLLALTIHECSHAYCAYRMGDPTAYRLGRVSLNPLRHLDPLGTICLLFAPIGWAKPVPVNPLNFDDPRKGDLVTTAAGPGSNLVQALVWALLLRGVLYWWPDTGASLTGSLHVRAAAGELCYYGTVINVGLAVFNCLPLYPLDGFHIFLQLTKRESQERFAATAAYGPFAIIGLVLLGRIGKTDILSSLINPPARFILQHVAGWV